MTCVRLLTATIFFGVLLVDPLRAAEGTADPVLAVLQPMAEAAAAANVRVLLNDPKTPTIGNPSANVAIVEFFDYQCSFCKAAEPKLQAMVKDDPNLKLVIKEFPILSPESITASKAALASMKQGKYTAYHQALMAYRGQLKEENIFQIAAQVGLDVDRLRRDMVAPEIADQIIANMSLARALKISVTPGLLVNTHILSGVSKDTESGKIDFKKEVALARTH